MGMNTLFNRNADFAGSHFYVRSIKAKQNHPILSGIANVALETSAAALLAGAGTFTLSGSSIAATGMAAMAAVVSCGVSMLVTGLERHYLGTYFGLQTMGKILDGAAALLATALGVDLNDTARNAAVKTITAKDSATLKGLAADMAQNARVEDPEHDARRVMINRRLVHNPYKVIGMALTGA